MATLRMKVLIGTTALPNTEANQRRMFVFSGAGSNSNGTGPYGNIPRKIARTGQLAYNPNNPAVPGAIAVTSYRPIFFESADFTNAPDLVGQVSDAIEKGYIEVVTTAAPSTPLTRSDLAAYI